MLFAAVVGYPDVHDIVVTSQKRGARAPGAFPKKGIRQDGGDTPKMRTCHCERSKAIFSIEIASSLALLAMTYLLR